MLCFANFYAIFVISQTSQNSRMILNTFDLQNDIKVKDGNYCGGQFIGGGNRSTRRKSPTWRMSLTKFIT
jgi:hypothetical protein